MKYTEYDNGGRDIYSSSKKPSEPMQFEDISSSSSKGKPKKSKKKKKGRAVRNTLIVFICFLLVFCGAFYYYAYSKIDSIDREPLSNIQVDTNVYKDYRNIALLGIDSREDNDVGRSDAIVILTIDKKHNSIKLTSIARDTYVSIEDHSKDKLTHAYAYGKSELAVKTLNSNFGLEITDYLTMNFHKLSRVIDYIGGVTVDVDSREQGDLNNRTFPEMRALGFDCPNITSPGVQRLNGAQAVCYARIRYIDGDIERGNRQKEVLMAMYSEVKKMGALKLPNVAQMILSECQTSLSTNDIMDLGMWAVLSSPEIKQLSIPNDNIPSSGKMISGGWYYVYDIGLAKNEIKDFIFEENFYSKETSSK